MVKYLNCGVRTEDFEKHLELMEEGKTVYSDTMFKFMFPMKGYKVEDSLYNGSSALKITKVKDYVEPKRMPPEEFDGHRERRKGVDMYSHYREVGLSPSDFI